MQETQISKSHKSQQKNRNGNSKKKENFNLLLCTYIHIFLHKKMLKKKVAKSKERKK